jgi:hypothetical protein
VLGLGLCALVGLAVVTIPKTMNPHVVLTAGEDFTIAGQLSSTPSPAVTPARFFPGTQRFLVLTVTNPQQVAIVVDALGVSVAPDSTSTPRPADCPVSDLDLSQASFTGSLSVAPDGGTASAWLPVALKDTGTNQDGCEGATFFFDYTGSAQYTEVYATTTTLGSSLDPSKVGQPVTYTATVTAVQGPSQDPVPSSPTGVVTFDDGSSVICAAVAVAPASTTTSTATCTPPTYETASAHDIAAIYTDNTGDGNFGGSSTQMAQSVKPADTTTSLVSSPTPSTFGQSVTLTASVTPGSGLAPTGTVTFYLGTPTGPREQLGTGTLAASGATGKAVLSTSSLPPGADSLYAVYGGSPDDNGSTSPTDGQAVGFPGACLAGTVNGGYVVKAGMSVCITGTVNGGLTVQPGGAVFVNGATVNGGLDAVGSTGLRVCGSTVNGHVMVTGSTGFVVIGDAGDDGPSVCAANTLSGAVTLTGNTAGLEIGGNHIAGAVTVSGNSGRGANAEDGAPELEGNTISGALSCASNTPAVWADGQRNTVSGARTGQCAAGL